MNGDTEIHLIACSCHRVAQKPFMRVKCVIETNAFRKMAIEGQKSGTPNLFR